MRVPTILLALLATLVFLSGCSKDTDQQATDQPKVISAKPVPNPKDQLIKNAAAALTEQFSKSLKSEVMAAMSQGGPAAAVDICSKRAPQIADSFAGDGWTIQRVSDRARNLANRADSAGFMALERFARDTTRKVISSVEALPGHDLYTIYQPIYIADMCLNCHGDPAKFAPEVTRALAKNYPADQATGYSVGDLRGLFVVTAKWPEGEARAEQLVQRAH